MVGAEGKGLYANSWSFGRACQLKRCPCRIVSAFRNKFEENSGNLIPKYGNLTFKQVNRDRLTDWRTDSVTKSSIWYNGTKNENFQFAKMVIDQSEQYEQMDIRQVDYHWRPYYLSPCSFCDVPFNGKYKPRTLLAQIPREAFVKFASVKVWT